MHPDTVKGLLRRYYTDVWLRGDATALLELLTDDYVDHNPMPGFGVDKTAAMAAAVTFTSGMRSASFDALDIIVEGDRAAAHWLLNWTQVGALIGIPADGKHLRLRGHDFFQVRDNR